MSSSSSPGPLSYVLGIDLGAHSLGWSILALDEQDHPFRIEAVGVHTFDAGVEASFDQMMQGKQESRAAQRREKRLPRRQFWRRAWRRYQVLKCLVTGDPSVPTGGLLVIPADIDIRQPVGQDKFLKALDAQLHQRLCLPKGDPRRHRWEQVWLYELRASALERKLELDELARAFYHLAQRRGFLSNRKTDAPEEEDATASKKSSKKKDLTDTTAAATVSPAKTAPDGSGKNTSPASDIAETEKKKEDTKQVKAAIAQLDRDIEQAIADSAKRTLGYYFARHVNPEERRIRQRWTSRAQYEFEFNAIWETQKKHYPRLLTDAFHATLHQTIFYQRPLKPCGHLVGHCKLEPDRKRAVQAIPLAQRFRLLQKVNDLQVIGPDDLQFHPLLLQQRETLRDALSTQGDMTFKQIRKLLNFVEPKINKTTKEVETPGHFFNLERGDEIKIPGDRTAAKIRACDKKCPGIAQHWNDLSDRHKEELVLVLLDFNNEQALAQHILRRFGFTPEQATVLAKVKLEENRCSLSRKAIDKLLKYKKEDGTPFNLEEGIPLQTVKKTIPEYRAKELRKTAQYDKLPRVLATDNTHVPIDETKPNYTPAFKKARDLRNPAVTRALAELRKVVNALIARYGKPARIHVEVGRELKKTPKVRERIADENKKRRKRRDDAQKTIVDANVGISRPAETDVDRLLLGQEQAWKCPYCPHPLEQQLKGIATGIYQIDHIIPESISLDNTMANKVLCHAECNQRKGKRAPYQAFGKDELQQIAKISAYFPLNKRQRLLWTEDDIKEYYTDENGGFTRRQLQDTQYSSRLAAEYLGHLYGGQIDDASQHRKVQVSSGGVTAILRAEWGLNAVLPSLPDSPAHTAPSNIRLDEKLRTDHRHHAIDAIVIALTNASRIQELSDAARRVELAQLRREAVLDNQGRPRRRFAQIVEPWPNFYPQVMEKIAGIIVSHRAEHKVSGPLHKETNYSKAFSVPPPPPPPDDGKSKRLPKPQPEEKKHRERPRGGLDALSFSDLKKMQGIIESWEKACAKKPSIPVPIPQTLIADFHLARKVVEKWKSLGCPDTKNGKVKVFDTLNTQGQPNFPVIGKTPEGKPVYVKTVRIWYDKEPVGIYGRNQKERFVIPGNNHHTVIVQYKDKHGDPYWKDYPCTMLEAVRRLKEIRRARRKKEPQPELIQKDWNARGGEYMFWFTTGDFLMIVDDTGTDRLYRCVGVSEGDNWFKLHIDARSVSSAAAGKLKPNQVQPLRAGAEKLRQRNARKVTVSPVGEVYLP